MASRHARAVAPSAVAPSSAAARSDARWPAAASAHILHDGYTDLLYVLLPVWQAEFGLGFAEVGLLRASYTGIMAALQIPPRCWPSAVARLWCWSAARSYRGLVFSSLALALVLPVCWPRSPSAASAPARQHPIASSLVSAVYHGSRSRAALGVYNFSGDLGKMLMPVLAALLLGAMPWRQALWVLGGLGIACAALVLALAPAGANAPLRPDKDAADRAGAAQPASAGPPRRGFLLLLAIAMIDSAGRSGFSTFLPFLFKARRRSIASIGGALSLLFVGGAAGKLVCGYLGARIGLLNTVLLTEGLTAIGIIALLPLASGGQPRRDAAPRHRSQWHVLGALRHGARTGGPGTSRARLRHFHTGAIAASAAMPALIEADRRWLRRHHGHDDHCRHPSLPRCRCRPC